MDTQTILADLLRDALRTIEQRVDISPEDPTYLDVKRILLLKIATLETEAALESASTLAPPPKRKPWPLPN